MSRKFINRSGPMAWKSRLKYWISYATFILILLFVLSFWHLSDTHRLSSHVYAAPGAPEVNLAPSRTRVDLDATRAVPPQEPCPCGIDRLALIAQAADDDPQPPAASSARPAASPTEVVLRAGELAAAGDADGARNLVQQAIWECDGGKGDVRDCSQALPGLRGLLKLLDAAPQRKVITNSIGMKLVRIPAGEYMMGSLKREMDWLRLTFRKTWREGHKQWFQDELPLHPVRITRPFYMGSTEVTVGQFRQFVEASKHKTDAEKGDGGMIFSKQENRWVPRKEMKWNAVPWRIGDDQPVVFVSWNDAKAFCRWLSRKEKRTYRLPTEAEWEMACRGGAVWARYPWGNRLPGNKDSNFGDGDPKLPESLTTVDDGYKYVAPVGSYRPNGFGLYDMAGNVMEWVEDQYDRNYYENSPLEDPKGPTSGSGGRVNKGGNWYSSPADDRCAFRGFSGPEMNFWNLGFRVVLEESDAEGGTIASKTEGFGKSSASTESDSGYPPSEADGIQFFRQAMFAAQQQQWEEAVQDLERAMKVYEKREDPLWTARVKATLAGIYAEQNRRYKSKELYTQALADFRRLGDQTSAKVILARLQDLETSPGVKVVKLKKGGIADKAGVVEGDVIIEYAGETGFRVNDFKKLVEEYSHAKSVTLSVMNNEEISTMAVAGGELGVALEDIKRPPRPRRSREEQRQPPRGRPDQRDRRGRR